MNKILVAYFSRNGENYVNGKIEKLKIGNSEYIAKCIQEMCEVDVFEIQCVKSYPKDYHETTDIALDEFQGNQRPELVDKKVDMSAYDTIILGYPNWWSTMPMAVCTFLESYDFTNKRILPYCTHEGSGLARSVEDIKRLCPNADVEVGLAIKGSLVKDAQQTVHTWLAQHGVTITA